MPGFYAAQIERDQKLLPKLRSFEDQMARQNRLAENLRAISPPLAMQSALSDLAATSFHRYLPGGFAESPGGIRRDFDSDIFARTFNSAPAEKVFGRRII
jgi:hypothetical protein